MTNLFIGTEHTAYGAFAGYVDDVRLYPYALSGDQIYDLYRSPATQCLSITSNYLTNLASTPSLAYFLAGNSAPLVDSASSYNGQYMVIVNSAISGNNVWYSTNYGVTWTAVAVTVSTPLISCSMSYDGSYVTVATSTTVYALNNNGSGFTLALGAQAGAVAQGANSIAIGTKAGLMNQTASSIVINATGSAVTATQYGFYVAPVAAASSAASKSVAILGYGDDKQVVQTGAKILSGGYTMFSDNEIVQVADVTIKKDSGASLAIVSGSENTNAILYLGTPWNPTFGVSSYGGNGSAYKVALIAKGNGSAMGWSTADLHFCLNGTQGTSINGGPGANDSSNSATLLDSKMVIKTGGNVGIGTIAPSAALTIYKTDAGFHRLTSLYINTPQAGIVLDSSQSTSGRKFNIFANTTGGSATDGSLCFFDITSGIYRMIIDPTGNVGIGATSPGYALHVAGAIYATGNITAFSDKRFKSYVEPLELPLDKICRLQGVSYHRTDREPEVKHIGLLAQDVAEVYPEAVSYDSINDRYSLNYMVLVAPLIEAVKELKATVKAQADEITALKDEIRVRLGWQIE